ncbi:thiamine phosphate synthase [Moraxella sp. K127]|uniref:thiamine phosphate synthase n=1 Tax=Moraxella sp. K127 TaxID=2780079 RepID=UPI0018811770|nr:thiamine phosphate synthase [Moraxella sp. K127]MBE9590878.1 thiamine phosphate synthase [Moraxella sp. K127]
MFDKSTLSVYFVAGTQDCTHRDEPTPEQRLLAVLENALQAGITCYQFREKGDNALTCPDKIKKLALDCQALCRQYGVPFVINNDVHLCLDIGADGVHVGQTDMDIHDVARLCRGRAFVGLSHSSLDEIGVSVGHDLADYLAIGAVFDTRSKADAGRAVGVDMVGQVRAMIGNRPLVAIGGIDTTNASLVRANGADGVACVSVIARADDMGAVVGALKGT